MSSARWQIELRPAASKTPKGQPHRWALLQALQPHEVPAQALRIQVNRFEPRASVCVVVDGMQATLWVTCTNNALWHMNRRLREGRYIAARELGVWVLSHCTGPLGIELTYERVQMPRGVNLI